MNYTTHLVGDARQWLVVRDEDRKEMFRASIPGQSKRAHRECACFIAAQKYTIEHYRESARRADEVGAWIESLRPIPRGAGTRSKFRWQ